MTGSLIVLAGTGTTATIDPVGAGLCSLVVNGVDLVESYDPDAAERAATGAPFAAGATLFPWPNRVRDGRWFWRGTEHELIVNEPDRANANHGLVRARRFDLVRQTANSASLSVSIGGDRGFPFALDLLVTYTLRPDGIEAGFTVHNRGAEAAPFAVGSHPYLRVAGCGADDLVLYIDAATMLELDERLLPVGRRPVAGTPDDPAGLELRDIALNHCYGDLVEGRGGGFVHRLTNRDGSGVELRTDPSFRWVQVYTAPDFPRERASVRAVAIEPMTAPPDALNSGRDLITVSPGQSWNAGWSLHALPVAQAAMDDTTESASICR